MAEDIESIVSQSYYQDALVARGHHNANLAINSGTGKVYCDTPIVDIILVGGGAL